MAIKLPWKSVKPVEEKASPVPLISSASSGRPVTTDWNAERAIRDGLKANTWVYVANRYIATKISPIPFFVEQRRGEDEWEPVVDHPAALLLNAPNPIMSGQDLRERWLYQLGLAGNAVSAMTIIGRVPVEIWPIQPWQIKPVPQVDGPIDYYEFSAGGTKRRLDPNTVVHMMYIDPESLYWGMSPLQAVSRVVDTDIAAIKWNQSALNNRAKKDYAFFPQQPITKAQWEEARAQLDIQHTGTSNIGGWFLGAMPGTLEELGMSPRDMDFTEGRVMSRGEILAAYGLQEILVMGTGTFRNYETAVRQFWEDTAVPSLDDTVAELNHSIIPWFDPESRGRPNQPISSIRPNLRFNYDKSKIAALQENFSEKLLQARELVNLGYPLNVVNQRLGLGFDALPGGDVPGVPGSSTGAPEQVAARARANATKQADWGTEWKRLDHQRLQWENKVNGVFQDLFLEEGKAVSAAFMKGGPSAISPVLNARVPDWRSALETVYQEVITFFGEEEMQRLSRVRRSASGPASVKEPVFNPFANFIQDWVKRIAAQKVTAINESTRDTLATTIGKALDGNLSTDQIARLILEVFREWASDSDPRRADIKRSYTIARTEVGTAQNYAQSASAKQMQDQAGLQIQKRWISSRDERVRDSHELVDGEMVDLDDLFSNGLMHPNDPDGPAEEVINCRCVASNVVL